MTSAGIPPLWTAVARETFEYNLVPWMGRACEAWLRASMQPHPLDPVGQVLIPDRIYEVFKAEHVPLKPVTRQQLAAVGYTTRALPPPSEP